MEALTNDEVAMFADIDKFKKSLSKSNIVEVSAGIFLIIGFLFYAYIFRNQPILISVGSVFSATGGVCVVLYIFRSRIRKGETPPKEETLDYFKYWIVWYENTYKLARNVFWWYLLPFIPGFITFCSGRIQLEPENSLQILMFAVSVFIFGGGVYWLNRYRCNKKLQPRIDKLRACIVALELK
jgi:hypothetical protein